MRYIGYIFWFLVIVFGITFASLNSTTVILNFYLAQKTLWLPLLLLIALILGSLLGIVVMLRPYLHRRCEVHRLRGQVRDLETEVNNLRALPLRDAH